MDASDAEICNTGNSASQMSWTLKERGRCMEEEVLPDLDHLADLPRYIHPAAGAGQSFNYCGSE